MDSVGSSIGAGSTGGGSGTTGHVGIGSGSTFPCKECGKVFNRQERLFNHMVSTHPNRPHRCTISNCGKEFKIKAHLIRHCAQVHGVAIRPGSPSRPIMKTRAAFYLHTNEATKVARRICPQLFRPRHFARKPFQPINLTAIKSECKLPKYLICTYLQVLFVFEYNNLIYPSKTSRPLSGSRNAFCSLCLLIFPS